MRKAISNIVFPIAFALIGNGLFGQVEVSGPECYIPIIDEIGSLESNKDPKCHATASRLENFMYGTPLSEEARILRMDLQKALVRQLWSKASAISDPSQPKLSQREVLAVANEMIGFSTQNDEWFLQLIDGNKINIDQTDFRQYSSIAYGLRAILAVQQEALFDLDNPLKVLDSEAVNRIKFVVDLATLGTLKLADFEARKINQYEVSREIFQQSWKQIIAHDDAASSYEMRVNDYSKITTDFSMLKRTIDQKLASYEAYNKIGQAVFLRNIQVYFAKKQWPKEPEEAKKVENLFKESLIYFAIDLIQFSERLAVDAGHPVITFDDMNRAVKAFLPYNVNHFEDVIYFPLLPKEEQVVIEAYDLDAFRDSGVHWQYVKFAIADPNFKSKLEPDPFAAELLVEAMAQIGVLIWRKGGEFSGKEGSKYLTYNGMVAGMENIRESITRNNGRYGAEDTPRQRIVSSEDEEKEKSQALYFENITAGTGIKFEHRSADWLSRQIRSYVVKEDEKLARIAIPPAFGGSGVAAEDINHDHLPDILLLSGAGNKLYMNKGDGTFEDVTLDSGIDWRKADGNYAEPRQPIIVDFNNDGHQDIFISFVDDGHRIYQGDGTGHFIDKTAEANLGGEGLVGGPCTALDYDRDGLLDIYIGYFGNYLEGELPTLARDNINGTPNKLFRNRGNFVFEDVSKGSGVENAGWTQAVGHADINNDGWQDLIVGNDFGKNGYYINNGDGTFNNRSVELGTDKPSYTMNVGIADLNRDQYPDFYISNIVVMEKDDKYVSPNEDTKMHFNTASLATMRVVEANDLFMSKPSNSGVSFELSDLVGRGFSSTGWAWDADFFDFDNDGDEDLYCLNGMNDYSVYGTDNEYYRSPEGAEGNVSYAESAKEKNVFFENREGSLQNNSAISGLDFYHTSRSAAYLDYDQDGDQDIIVNNYHGEAYFFKNMSEREGHNWLDIKLTGLVAKGSSSDAIGAKVMVSTPQQQNMWQEVHSTTGYLSGHPKTLHFGLGKSSTAEIVIIWPNGSMSKQSVDQVNRIIEIIQKP